jgi:hypothetical protein
MKFRDFQKYFSKTMSRIFLKKQLPKVVAVIHDWVFALISI